MEITFAEIKQVADLINRRAELFDDTEAEALAKMVVLAGRDTTFNLYGPASQGRHAQENVLGMEKCSDCGKYLRHTCGREILNPRPSEAPLRVMAEVSRNDIRPDPRLDIAPSRRDYRLEVVQ